MIDPTNNNQAIFAPGDTNIELMLVSEKAKVL